MTEFNQGFARIKPDKERRFLLNESEMKENCHARVKISILSGRVIPRAADAPPRSLVGIHKRGVIRRDNAR